MLKKRNNLTNIRRNSNKNKTKKNVEKIVKKKSSNNVKNNVKKNVKKVVKKKSSNNVKKNVKRITKHKKRVKKKNSKKKTRKMVGGAYQPPPLTPAQISAIQPYVDSILAEWKIKFDGYQVAMDGSPEDGHPNPLYYYKTLLALQHPESRITDELHKFVQEYESNKSNLAKILVIDGENKMGPKAVRDTFANHNPHGPPPVAAVEHYKQIFNHYNTIIIVYKSSYVNNLIQRCIHNNPQLSSKLYSYNLQLNDVSLRENSVDDMLVVFIVRYLERDLDTMGINTRMGINRGHSQTRAFRTEQGSYRDPSELRGYDVQLSVATGDKYIFI